MSELISVEAVCYMCDSVLETSTYSKRFAMANGDFRMFIHPCDSCREQAEKEAFNRGIQHAIEPVEVQK